MEDGCVACGAGRFSPSVGAASESDCALCSKGFFCPAGANKQALCRAGFYGDKEGAANDNCRGECPLGSYCPQGTANPRPCPAGRFGNALGLVNDSCTAECPAGNLHCPSGSSEPLPCPLGRFGGAPNLGECKVCVIGTAPRNASALNGDCAACPPGKSAEQYGAVCAPCPRNMFRATNATIGCEFCPLHRATGRVPDGANSSEQCRTCPIKYYTREQGEDCRPCPAGQITSGAGTACFSIDVRLRLAALSHSRFSGNEGFTSSSTRIVPSIRAHDFNPSHFSPLLPSPSLFSQPECAPGFTPKAPQLGEALRPSEDCVPLECPPFAIKTSNNVACEGCPMGSFGNRFSRQDKFRACINCSTTPAPCGEFSAACSNDSVVLCPGFLSLPLAADPAKFAQRAPAGPDGGACVTAPDSSVSYATNAVVVFYYYYLAAAAGAFLTLAIFLYALCARTDCCLGKAAAARLREARAVTSGGKMRAPLFKRLCRFFDCAFSRQAVSSADTKLMLMADKRSAFGGVMFLAFAVLIISLWTWLFLEFVYNNVVQQGVPDSQSPTSVLQERSRKDKPSRWAAPANNVLRPPLPPDVNLQLRLLGQRALGCGAPEPLDYGKVAEKDKVQWSSNETRLLQSQFPPLSWIISNTSCTPEAPPGPDVSLLTLSCINCELSANSFVGFALPFQCQSFYLEMVSVDALGNVGVVSLDTRFSVATKDGRLLTSVTWTLAPVLSVLEDSAGVVPDGGAVGYRLSQTDASSTTVDPAAELVDGGFQPKAGLVMVRVELPLQPTLTRTVVSKRQTWPQVVASGVGFLSLV
jgi:hypothetical protein